VGLLLLVIGIFLSSISLFGEIGKESVILIFPFLFSYLEGSGGIIITLIFFSLMLLSTFLPWYLTMKRNQDYYIDKSYSYKKFNKPWDQLAETLEFIITSQVPDPLYKTLYLETDGNKIFIKSRKDLKYKKSYSLPSGFNIGNLDYDYDGDYLVIKLHLLRDEEYYI
jgi:hypothetical protein